MEAAELRSEIRCPSSLPPPFPLIVKEEEEEEEEEGESLFKADAVN